MAVCLLVLSKMTHFAKPLIDPSILTAPPPSFWDHSWGSSVCQSGVAGVLPGVVGLQLFHLAIQRAQQRSNNLCQAQSQASSVIWCIVVVAIDPHGALAFVAHALQGPWPARTVLHPRLWEIIPTVQYSWSQLCFFLSLDFNILFTTLGCNWSVLLSEGSRHTGCRNRYIWQECGHNCRMMAYVWVLVGSAQRRKKQCSFARQTCAHASPCCRLTFCHHGE